MPVAPEFKHAARLAVAELRRHIAEGAQGPEPQDLMKLADIAVAGVDASDEARKTAADRLIEGLTVLRFAPTLGGDPEVGRKAATGMLDLIETYLD